MARPNKKRAVNAEANVAERIRREREARGWTLEGFAKRMEDVGCPIQPSAIYKIETSDPPRRITVDELVAFSRVLGVPLARMTSDPDNEIAGVWHADALVEDFADRIQNYRASIEGLRQMTIADLSDIVDDLRGELMAAERDEEPFIDRLRTLMTPQEQTDLAEVLNEIREVFIPMREK